MQTKFRTVFNYSDSVIFTPQNVHRNSKLYADVGCHPGHVCGPYPCVGDPRHGRVLQSHHEGKSQNEYRNAAGARRQEQVYSGKRARQMEIDALVSGLTLGDQQFDLSPAELWLLSLSPVWLLTQTVPRQAVFRRGDR